jgi:hypothetical protein
MTQAIFAARVREVLACLQFGDPATPLSILRLVELRRRIDTVFTEALDDALYCELLAFDQSQQWRHK